MKKSLLILSLTSVIGINHSYTQLNITYNVNTQLKQHSISPWIYGSNQDLLGDEGITFFRQGGNRMTGYNWENNASNAGVDWYHNSDNYLTSIMGINGTEANQPGKVITQFHLNNVTKNAASIVTLPLAGYVAHDKNGTVAQNETAPSARWDAVLFTRGNSSSTPHDPNDQTIYVDECINFLVQTLGKSDAGGIQAYSMDNEPDLWSSTHPRIHPIPVGCDELVEQNAKAASRVKRFDPKAEVFGFVSYGITGYATLQDAPDWDAKKANYDWYIDFFLDKMKSAGDTAGKRLLDVLDLHWYPEATGDHRITGDDITSNDIQARLQAPRTLWDASYVENSWVGQWMQNHLPLIPKIQTSINTYYPNTKLSFSEYNYGAGGHISGGIAQADVLGIFGKYNVHAANLWLLSDQISYQSAAFKIYRNYDGNYNTFGNISVSASNPDTVNSSIYTSSVTGNNGEVHIIVINKNINNAINATINVSNPVALKEARVWGFDATSSNITQRASVSNISNNSFQYTIPKLSVLHFILNNSTVGIAEQQTELNNILIAPNPATTEVTIYNNQLVDKLLITDVQGRRVYEIKESFSGDKIIDISNLRKGLYFVILNKGAEQITKKLIVE